MSHKIENKPIQVEVVNDDFTTVQVNENNVAIIVNPNEQDWIYGEYMRIRRKRIRAVSNVASGSSGGGGSEPDPEPPATTLINGIVSAWKLDDVSGDAIDSVGDNNGTVSGATQNIAGKINTAYSFDGNDFIAADSVVIDVAANTSGTWSAWVKPTDATPAAVQYIMGFGDTNANERISLFINTTGVLQCFCAIAGVNQFNKATTSPAFSDGVWTHVAVTQTGSGITLYVNGVAVAQSYSVSTNITRWMSSVAGVDNFRIGCLNFNNGGNLNFFNGSIDDVNIWNRALTADEVTELYNSGAGNTYPFETLLTLESLSDLQVVQRVVGQAAVTISGNYYSATDGIQARVVDHNTDNEVVAWTTITMSQSEGLYSGTITVPEGGWYNIQIRKLNNDSVRLNTSLRIGVGVLVGVIGQSQAEQMFTTTSSPDSVNDITSRFDETGWARATANGAIRLGNTLATALGVPIGLLDFGVSGSALFFDVENGFGWWRDEAGQPSANWAAFISASTGLDSIGGLCEYIVWMQGEREAISAAKTSAQYVSGFADFRTNQLYGEIQNNIPIIITTLARTSNPSNGTDASWSEIRNAQETIGGLSNHYLVNLIDMPYGSDDIHWSAAGRATASDRIAQAILFSLSEVSFYLAPTITSFSVTGADTVTVAINHNGGTDFTPTSGITGFSATDNTGALTITSAVRTNATTITLTFNRSIDGLVTLRYMYGRNPTVTGAVYDNSSLTLPLLPNSNITEV